MAVRIYIPTIINKLLSRVGAGARAISSNEGSLIGDVCAMVRKDSWDEVGKTGLLNSSLAALHISQILMELKEEASLALQFFEWAGEQHHFEHTTESCCILFSILHWARMHHHAKRVLADVVKKQQNALPTVDLFDMIYEVQKSCGTARDAFDMLLRAYTEAKALDEASEVFYKMKRSQIFPTVYSCNMLLMKLCDAGRGAVAWKIFADMFACGVMPNVYTYNIMIKFSCKERDLHSAVGCFKKMKQMHCQPGIYTYNSLIDGICKYGKLEDAEKLYCEMKADGACKPDVVTYNILLSGYNKQRKLHKSLEVFQDMYKDGVLPNVISFNTFIDGLCKEGLLEKANEVFNCLSKVGVHPNEFTFTILIHENCKAGNLEQALKLYDQMEKMSLSSNVAAAGAMIDGCRKKIKVGKMWVIRTK